MKAVMLLFDSLNRRFLPNYGAQWVHAPHFERLGRHTVTFDNCYAGSMPCMPARRELHTGRGNFLHRSWGPLEPFDDSVPELLGEQGVYTHLVTDHPHYWEDGGATYHGRFRTFEFFRGQEGDAWKGHVADPRIPEDLHRTRNELWRQDWINRQYMPTAADHPQTRTVDAGLEFLRTNGAEEDWFLQIETFDPHEPFFSYAEHKAHYPHEYSGPHFDWPDYKEADEPPAAIAHARKEYAALLTMCDASLGRVLDAFDTQDLWSDTMLVVCTDHGFLLGEHGWWAKNTPPWYDENIHTPLFVWDPRTRHRDERRGALVQTVDLAVTLLDAFGIEPTPDMEGRSLLPAVDEDATVRETALFGGFGAHVSVTDGRYVYMRASATEENTPLFEHTLMPTHMTSRFTPEELRSAELVPPLSFTKSAPVLRMPATFTTGRSWRFGTLLFDLSQDPEQESPLADAGLERRMVRLLVDAMRRADAPPSQYERLGLPADGVIEDRHLHTAPGETRKSL